MTMLTLKHLADEFTVHRLKVNRAIPNEVFNEDIFFLAKTNDEISIVISSKISIESDSQEPAWQALKVIGPLDFSLTGILAKLSTILAENSISIFAISTFDTDYILVKNDSIQAAKHALTNNNYNVI